VKDSYRFIKDLMTVPLLEQQPVSLMQKVAISNPENSDPSLEREKLLMKEHVEKRNKY
jgi:hypothetical protein